MNAWWGPSKLPLGWSTFVRPRTVRTCSRLSPYGELNRVDLDPHCRLLASLDHHCADAGHFAQLLREHRVGNILHLWDRLRFGRKSEDKDRLVCRIHFFVHRWVRQAARQGSPCRIDSRLYVLPNRVNVPVKDELHGDRADAKRACRGHQQKTCDLSQLLFQRCRDQRGHCVWACTGKLCRDLDSREVDLGQRGDWEQAKSQSPGDNDRNTYQ